LNVRERASWWIRVAERDIERALDSLSRGDKAAATFWAQQAAEKALKGLLLLFKGSFPSSHSIRRLIEELNMDLGLSEEELEEAYELTQYYYLSRYPDVVEGVPDEAISWRAAEKAVAISRRIVEAAKRALEQGVRAS